MSPPPARSDDGIQDLAVLLRDLRAERQPGIYRFARIDHVDAIDLDRLVCLMHEPEGLSIVARESELPAGARAAEPPCCWITLQVHSSLAAVGLTAAVASALAQANIACNVVAGTCHDHLFVPVNQADAAMAVLKALQNRSDDYGTTP
ncbi:hypothetical protein T5B8_05961 [Salinisphaera sp. T5B8]|uniref:ACT domain-containing protein n=1 Tax=Salinisphaera sp. T5B8 TaxID=1304154 RepID=UPI0033421C9B